MGWLVSDDQVLATIEAAESVAGRARGLIGRKGIDGALLLRPAKAVHTFGVRFAIDVAFCDRDLVVIDVVTMAPNRLGRPRWGSYCVIEAPARSFSRWGIGIGSELEILE